jgi:flagellar hook assembly protein FlgD
MIVIRPGTRVDAMLAAGVYTVTWHGRDDADIAVPGGTYFYQLDAANLRSIRKMTLLK